MVSSAITSALTGLAGVIVGAIVSNYINHKIALKSTRKDLFFKKRVEYFEKLVQCIEKNTKMYEVFILSLKQKTKKNKIKKILENLKKNRCRFDTMASPLYLDTTQVSTRIRNFVSIEKKIFFFFNKLNSLEKDNSEIIQALDNHLELLKKSGKEIIIYLRNNLEKY